jgi:hypothetical protein
MGNTFYENLFLNDDYNQSEYFISEFNNRVQKITIIT